MSANHENSGCSYLLPSLTLPALMDIYTTLRMLKSAICRFPFGVGSVSDGGPVFLLLVFLDSPLSQRMTGTGTRDNSIRILSPEGVIIPIKKAQPQDVGD